MFYYILAPSRPSLGTLTIMLLTIVNRVSGLSSPNSVFYLSLRTPVALPSSFPPNVLAPRPPSSVKHRTSNVIHQTSNVQRHTSNIERPTSNVQRRTSNVTRPTISLSFTPRLPLVLARLPLEMTCLSLVLTRFYTRFYLLNPRYLASKTCL
jgi:hypothetical protein